MAIKDDERGRMTKTVRERIEGSVANSDENERPEGGGPTTDFVRSAMLAASERAIQAHEVLTLTSEGAAAFVEAITNPPEPNEELRALAREDSWEAPGQAEV